MTPHACTCVCVCMHTSKGVWTMKLKDKFVWIQNVSEPMCSISIIHLFHVLFFWWVVLCMAARWLPVKISSSFNSVFLTLPEIATCLSYIIHVCTKTYANTFSTHTHTPLQEHTVLRGGCSCTVRPPRGADADQTPSKDMRRLRLQLRHAGGAGEPSGFFCALNNYMKPPCSGMGQLLYSVPPFKCWLHPDIPKILSNQTSRCVVTQSS